MCIKDRAVPGVDAMALVDPEQSWKTNHKTRQLTYWEAEGVQAAGEGKWAVSYLRREPITVLNSSKQPITAAHLLPREREALKRQDKKLKKEENFWRFFYQSSSFYSLMRRLSYQKLQQD